MSSIKYSLNGILWEAQEEGNQIVKDHPVVVLFKSLGVLFNNLSVLDYGLKVLQAFKDIFVLLPCK